MSGQFLRSHDPRVRRASAVVYACATGIAVAAWLLLGGWGAVAVSDWLAVAFSAIWGLMAWWIAAGVGLRIVRRMA